MTDLSSLADSYAADFWGAEAASVKLKPTDKDYSRKRYLQMLYEIKRDIHILAMGMSEALERLEKIEGFLVL